MDSVHKSAPLLCSPLPVRVIGVKGKDKGETHKEKKGVSQEEEMVDQHCCAEKQAEASKSVSVEQFHFF